MNYVLMLPWLSGAKIENVNTLNPIHPWALRGGIYDGVVEPAGNGGEAGEAHSLPDIDGHIGHRGHVGPVEEDRVHIHVGFHPEREIKKSMSIDDATVLPLNGTPLGQSLLF